MFLWRGCMIVFTNVTTVTAVTPLKKKYFRSTFGKNNMTHLTTDVIFSGQRFAILVMFYQLLAKPPLLLFIFTFFCSSKCLCYGYLWTKYYLWTKFYQICTLKCKTCLKKFLMLQTKKKLFFTFPYPPPLSCLFTFKDF